MKNTFSLVTMAALLGLCCLAVSARGAGQNAESPGAGRQAVVVQDKFGGQILGYDVDRNGTEGMLSEYVLLNDGNLMIATETFDQTTGKILKVVAKKTETQDNFITLGIVGSHIGLELVEHVKDIYVNKRTYSTISPLDGNKFTGTWNPPFTKNDIIISVADAQGSPTTAVIYFNNGGSNGPFVIGTNVGANTFGKPVALKNANFTQLSVMDYDSQTNQAVVGGSVGCFGCSTEIGLLDLTKGSVKEFEGLGAGAINGIAVDSATGIACTTTQSDYNAEFYDLAKQTGIVVPLPNLGAYPGETVANDPQHKLFLITHPEPFSDGEIHVYNEKGKLIKSLSGFALGPGGAYIALNPSKRTGFVLAAGLASLQSFTY